MRKKHATPTASAECRGSSGFTLVELLVVMVIVGSMVAMLVPSFATSLAESRDRSTIAKFQQDFEWTRMRASQPGVTRATLTLNADCSWTSSTATAAASTPAVDSMHSMTSGGFTAKRTSLTCSAAAPLDLPVTFVFNNQGFVSPSGAVAFEGAHHTANLQALSSGSLVRTQTQ